MKPIAARLRNTGMKSSSRRDDGTGCTGAMPRQAAIIASGPSAVRKKAERQPSASAAIWAIRNERPTPTENVAV